MECFVQDLVPFLSVIGRSRDESYLLVFLELFDLVSVSICSATTSFSSILSSLSIISHQYSLASLSVSESVEFS